MRVQSDGDVLDERGGNVLSDKRMASSKLDRIGRMAAKSSGPRTRCSIPLLLGLALLAAIPCCAMGQEARTESSLAGSWKGELGEGAGKLHLILTITKLAGAEYSGELVSVDQSASLPMENVTLKDDAVRFEVKAVGGVYEGKWNAARTEIVGTWTQNGVPAQPLKFQRSVEDSAAKEKTAQSMPEG